MRASGPWEADVRTVEVESAISILVARVFEPRLTDVRTRIFELRFLPYVWVSPNGKPRRPNVCINLPLFWTWKESESDRSLLGIRTCCWNVRTDASWNRSFSIQWRVRTERYYVRTDDAGLSGVRTGWHVVRTDGTVDRWASGRDDTSSRQLTGNLKSSIFSAESFEKDLTSGIPVYSTFTYTSDFVQTQNEAKILTVMLIFWIFVYWKDFIFRYPALKILREDENVIYVNYRVFTWGTENIIHDILKLTWGLSLDRKALRFIHIA